MCAAQTLPKSNELGKTRNSVICQVVSNVLGFFLVLIYSHSFASTELSPPLNSAIFDCWFTHGGLMYLQCQCRPCWQLQELKEEFWSKGIYSSAARHLPGLTGVQCWGVWERSWTINLRLMLSVGMSLQFFHTGATLTQAVRLTEPKEVASFRLIPNKTSPSNYCVLIFWCTWGKRVYKILPWFYWPKDLSGLGLFSLLVTKGLQSPRICFLLTFKLESIDS